MAKPIILDTTDSVTVCDCCGKSNLKMTFICDVDGEIVHYGSTCVTRHTGKTHKEIKAQFAAELQARIDAARAEYRASPERAAYQAKTEAGHAQKILPGRAFREFIAAEAAADDAVCTAIAARHNVTISQTRY
jgi:hypothetical protein